MSLPTDPCSPDHSELARLVDQVTEMLEAGDSIDVEALLHEYPRHAEQIQDLLPAMTALMELNTNQANEKDSAISELSRDDSKPRTLGDFRIGREIGRGGMGIVYEAEQISMHRRVALKVLPLAGLVDGRQIRRFQNEVRAVAALSHPHIVPVYMVGEERGVHYYAMQLIRGRSLSEVLSSLRREQAESKGPKTRSVNTPSVPIKPTDVKPGFDPSTEVADHAHIRTKVNSEETGIRLDGSTIPHATHREYFRNIATIGIQAATALQHAHDEGIIHRDVKPANLLLDNSSKLYLTDFGLARIESDVGMTMTGDLIGTLRYMAPEQALAKPVIVDHRADIYSLAATLYELLTLQPAYLADDRQRLLNQIAFADPIAPRRINRGIPVELETIVLKAMSKDMDDRYASAQAVADDLQSYLDHRTIKAKPPSVSQSIGKWVRRNPVVVSAASIIGMVLLVATTVSCMAAFRAVQARKEVAASADRNHRLSYLSGIHLAHQIYKDSGDLARASKWLSQSLPETHEEELRGFEWYYLWNVCRSEHSVRVLPRVGKVEVAFSPDNLTFVTGGSDGMIQVWDRRTLKRIGEPWPVAPDPYSQYRSIDVLYSPSGDVVAGLFRDGFFQVKGRVVLFDTATGQPRTLAHRSPNDVIRIAFKNDGTLLTAEIDGHVRSWNASTGVPLGPAKRLADDVVWIRAAFSSDFELLAAAEDSEDVKVTIYRINTGTVETELEATAGAPGKLQFTGDSRFLINPGNPPFGEAKLVAWDIATGEVILSRHERKGLRSYAGAVSISGEVVAVGGSKSISFVNPSRREVTDHWRGVPGIVTDLAVSPDGKQLASTGWDGMVRFWDLPRRENPTTIEMKTAPEICFSPSGDELAFADNTSVVLRDSHNLEELHRFDGEKRPVFSSRGDLLATISADNSSIRIRDCESGLQVGAPLAMENLTLRKATLSADGKTIGCVTDRGPVFVVDVETREILNSFDIPAEAMNRYRYVAFGTNDQGQPLVALPANNREIRLVNLESGEEKVLSGPTTQIYGIAVSPDSRRIVSFGNDIFAWNMNTGEQELGIEENTGATQQVVFSPDGKSILTRGFKHNVGLWDLVSGREKMRLLEEFGQTTESVAFSPDGTRIMAAVNDSALMTWVAPPID